MLTLNIGQQEFYDSEKSMFVYTDPVRVRLEHSLISVSKWESIWEKPFLPTKGKADGMAGRAEENSYIECMIIGEVPDHVPGVLLDSYGKIIREYIEKKNTATIIYRHIPTIPSRQVVTTELIYYWMIKFGIPFECQRWHLNRLLMLIEVCSIKDTQSKDSRMSSGEAANHIQKLNKARKSL